MTPAGLTIAEIEKMRALVNAADAANQGGNKEFDLAKPPVAPYRYNEYPRVMYHHATGRTKVANSAEDREDAEALGWTISAIAPVEADEDPFAGLSAEDAAAAREADDKLAEGKPKHAGGRPRKIEVG